MPRVFVGIGSNLRPQQNLKLAVRELRARYGDVRLSPVYRNAAVGFDGDDFLNMVAGFESDATPAELNADFERIHGLAGRVRDGARLVSRTLDIDLLLYGDTVSATPPLPRRDVLDYDFVLRPLAELAPHLEHPLSGRPLGEHRSERDDPAHPLEPVQLDF